LRAENELRNSDRYLWPVLSYINDLRSNPVTDSAIKTLLLVYGSRNYCTALEMKLTRSEKE